MSPELFLLIAGAVSVVLIIVITSLIFKVLGQNKPSQPPLLSSELERLERITKEDARALREELAKSLLNFNDSIRKTVEERLDKMNFDNKQKLDEMRTTVDEKLHVTLEKRLGESFSQVSERLEKVHQGLGEMQLLASDVGGLKRVLSNVKTRGTWGEVQLGALLEQMLTPEQYIKNAHIDPASQEVVEYAIKLPEGEVLIPIDSKFPIEAYERLIDAAEKADTSLIDSASVELERQIRLEAKRIASKYVCPPKTTDFAIMFLPTEGLYAEVMKKAGLAGEIQAKHRVSIAGPSTLGAFLNSLQMGFRSVLIQKRSGEVWQTLNEVKTEFEKYISWVEKVKRNIELTSKTLDEADTRTRAMARRLRHVSESSTKETLRDELDMQSLPSNVAQLPLE
ncbi:MAG: DNA recombination protein RmuC [Alphaproteobacteria bacterium]|nr:DNA recombination protein RmuC [Alphaproteobacteria bacterium]